jgi:hypothetical protein
MASEQPWFLTRVVPDMDSGSQFPSPEMAVCTKQFMHHKEVFPGGKQYKKVGFLPRGQRIFVPKESSKT